MRIFYLFTLLLLTASCSRSIDAPSETGETYIKFKVNGVPYQFNGGLGGITSSGTGVYGFKQIASSALFIPKTRYSLQGQSGLNAMVNMVVVTDTLHAGHYITTSDISEGVTYLKIDSTQYGSYRATDTIGVNISRVSAGSFDGTFSGKLVSVKTTNSVTIFKEAAITEGEFKNVQITY